MIATISNLYPTPPVPSRGVFNARLFAELHTLTPVRNTVPVPTLSPHRQRLIRAWRCPLPEPPTTYLPYQHLPLVGRSLSWRLLAAALGAQLRRDRDGGGVEALLASWLYPDGCAAAAAAPDGLPVYVMVLGSDIAHLAHRQRGRIIRRMDPRINGYICVARHLGEALTAGGLPAAKVHVIPNGVDTGRFHPDPEAAGRSRTGLLPGRYPLILFIGNLTAVKAPGLALESFAQAMQGGIPDPAADPTPRQPALVVIGCGEQRRRLKKHAAALGLAGQVQFLGTLPQDDIAPWIRRADALLLTSRSEGMPNVVAEALACGTPVVATDAGACREMLRHQPCCRVATPSTPDAIATALRTTLQEAAATESRPRFTRSWADMAQDVHQLISGQRIGRRRLGGDCL